MYIHYYQKIYSITLSRQIMEQTKSNDIKKNNARIMKWRQMLEKGLFKDRELLVKRVRKGIPPSLRIKVWPQLIPIKKYVDKKPMTYSKVLIKDSFDIYDINLDIPRTFSFESQEILRKSLFNVLKALSIQYPDIGYCQGMNFLAMRILQVINDDIGFYIMSYLIKNHKQIYDNFRNPGYVTRQNEVFKWLLEKHIPKVAKKLIQDNIDPVLYTPAWFVTLYSKVLDQSKFYRFFDCFLLQGYQTVYQVALTLIKLKEKQILTNAPEQNLMFVPNMQFYQDVTDDDFINTMMSFKVKNQQILQKEEQYAVAHRNTIVKMEDKINECNQRKRKQFRLATEWTNQDFQKMQFSYVKFD